MPQASLPSSPPKVSGQIQSKNADALTNSIDSQVLMVGWAMEAGKVRVALSNGRWVGQEDGLTQVTREYCIVQGHIYRMRSLDEQVHEQNRSLWDSSRTMKPGLSAAH